jgi:dinuclear metal center YbgI/SA1388 family protein
MSKVTIGDIASAIEAVAPLSLQEEWDCSGFSVGNPAEECSGVMVCVDVTPQVIRAAVAAGCNMVVSHHPLIFRPIKAIKQGERVGDTIIEAIRSNVAIYSAHTSLDNAPKVGVSHAMAHKLGAKVERVMTATGTGVLATLPTPLPAADFCAEVKRAFELEGLRHSPMDLAPATISKVVMGGGACGFLIPDAIALGADAIVTADVRYHEFLDNADKIFIVDMSHFDSEKCTKEILIRIISQKFPNFALCICASEQNSIDYM